MKIALAINPGGGQGTPGGITQVVKRLLAGFRDREVELDLVLHQARFQPLFAEFAGRVELVNLNVAFESKLSSAIKLLPPLAAYYRRAQPDLLIGHLPLVNYLLVLGKLLAGSDCRVILVEHLPYQIAGDRQASRRPWGLTASQRWLYQQADAVVGVSEGVATSFRTQLGLPAERVATIYNPVIDESELAAQLAQPLDCDWLAPGQPPVILAVGRLSAQKNFALLLAAFAQLRQQRAAKLVILGEGEQRQALTARIADLELAADVRLPGAVANPYAWMSRAAVLALSSHYEGLPTVLIEALCCGCQIVATDCPSGPREILQAGALGRLVPVDDAPALAGAIAAALDEPIEPSRLRQRGEDFRVERAVAAYWQLCEQLLSSSR